MNSLTRITFGANESLLPLVGTVIPAIVTAAVALLVYTRQQRAKRRDQLRDLFSEALRAVADYQELPYLVRRRSDSEPMTPSTLSRHISEVQTRLDYYKARMALESQPLARAYDRLVSATRTEAGSQMSHAWTQPRLRVDADMPLGVPYPRNETEAAKAACISVMQRHIGVSIRSAAE